MTDEQLQAVARAICISGGFDPDEIMPNDGPRWQYYVEGAHAAILAMQPAIDEARREGAKAERVANYKSFTDGMEAAAEICGSLAETTYDDADAFEAATGCEAAIMRVVKEQRAEQAIAALDPAEVVKK